jgi:hypothetical protein
MGAEDEVNLIEERDQTVTAEAAGAGSAENFDNVSYDDLSQQW